MIEKNAQLEGKVNYETCLIKLFFLHFVYSPKIKLNTIFFLILYF